MATEKVFDFHLHLLLKHYITNKKRFAFKDDIRMEGLAAVLNDITGGSFDSQSSHNLIANSPVYLGVASILIMEHAFVNDFLTIGKLNISGLMPIDIELFQKIKNGEVTYYDEFKKHVQFHLDNQATLEKKPYNIVFLDRQNWKGISKSNIIKSFNEQKTRYLAFSIEGGHHLSNVPIRGKAPSMNPELQLKEIQDRMDIDFMSLNICHLSYIPEQPLAGFCQGLNRFAQTAFESNDFTPRHTDRGLTEKGKKVIRQALLHPSKPILIDVKHMSAYSRFQFYKFRQALAVEHPQTARLPIISSHTGFTFTSLRDFVKNKKYKAGTKIKDGLKYNYIQAENRTISRTDDNHNESLFVNPWSIGLYDEEIIEIMRSKGMIGISMDQRVIGTAKMMFDGSRPPYYEEEYIAEAEWKQLFVDGIFPSAEENIIHWITGTPTAEERHIMLFCTHLVYAVRLGYAKLPWLEGTSPWDHLCMGSDYDGLINPLNGYNDVTDLAKMRNDLRQYLPIADKYLESNDPNERKALEYNTNGTVKLAYLNEVIEKVVYDNGVDFMARYLSNWEL